ncbi:MAG: TRAP transporter large permease subunit, partial [Clostridia bacterium]|nr:TRAP transporter large permease subunit [Clostridia bacterium]
MSQEINPGNTTMQDVSDVMKKYDRESNVRVWEGKPKLVINALMILFSLFCIYATLFGNFLEQMRLSTFVGMVILIGYLNFPIRKGHVKVNSMPWYDVIIMIVGAGAFFFYAINAKGILNTRLKVILSTPQYTVIAVLGLLALVELCRRCVGLPILVVAAFFLIYTFTTGKGLPRVCYELFYSENGVLTTPINVCSKYIVVFIIFGAFLERTGISEFFISCANYVAGASAGGPAKVAVISSAL